MKKIRAKVYSTPADPFRYLVEEFLKEHNIPFKEINVEKDTKAYREMIRKSGQTHVPVIEIGKEIIVGFNKKRLMEVLKLG
jgi:glutaredoxin